MCSCAPRFLVMARAARQAALPQGIGGRPLAAAQAAVAATQDQVEAAKQHAASIVRDAEVQSHWIKTAAEKDAAVTKTKALAAAAKARAAFEE